MNKIPVEELRELLNYNPGTGELTWKVTRNNKTTAGQRAGSDERGKWRVEIDGRAMYAHRIAWAIVYGYWPTHFIDHINCVQSDNRLCNLREATPAQNSQNRLKAKSDSHSGVLGVKRNGRGWQARIQLNGHLMALGTFSTTDEAHAAYVVAKRRLHPFGNL